MRLVKRVLRETKRYTAFALAVIMLVTMLPVNTFGQMSTASASDRDITGISADVRAVTLEDGQTIQGTIDSCTVTIPKGVTVLVKGTITINGTVNIVGGGTLKRENSFAASMFRVPYGQVLNLGTSQGATGITVDGADKDIRNVNGAAFTVVGTLNTFGGTVIKNNKVLIDSSTTFGGGAVWVRNGGTFNMVSGIISNNSVNMTNEFRDANDDNKKKGGGAVLLHGNMIVSGGHIVGNSSSSYGGAVFIDRTGQVTAVPSFVMNGGTISGNTAGLSGGGVKAVGAGFSIGGTARITGNTAYDSTTQTYVQDNAYIDIANTTKFYPQIALRYTGSAGFNSDVTPEAGGEFASVSAMIKDNFTAAEAARLFCDGTNLVGSVKEGDTSALVWRERDADKTITACSAGFLAGTVVKADVTPANGTAHYQWYRNVIDSTADGVAIPGTYGASYTLSPEDIGQYLYCRADGRDGYTGSAVSGTVYVDSDVYTTVEFDMQGHGDQVDPVAAKIDEPIDTPASPTVSDGYQFGGWYTSESCITSWDFADPVTAGLILYAEWSTAPTATPAPTECPADDQDYIANDTYKMVYNSRRCVTEMWYNKADEGTTPDWQYQYYGKSSFGYALRFKCNGKTYNYYTSYFSGATADYSNSLQSNTPGYSVVKSADTFKVQWKDLAITGTDKHFTFILENSLSEAGILKNFSLSTGDATGDYAITNIELSYGGDTYFGGSDSGLSYRVNTDGLAMAYLRQSSGGSLETSLVMSLTSTNAKSVYAGNYWQGCQWASAFTGTNFAQNGTEECDGKGTSSVDNGYYMYWNRIGDDLRSDTSGGIASAGDNEIGLTAGNIVSTSCFESISNKGSVRALPAGTKDFAAGKAAAQSETINAFAIVNFSSDTVEVNNLAVTNNGSGITTTPMTRSFNIPAGGAVLVPVKIDVAPNTAVGNHKLTLTANVGNNTLTAVNSIRTRYPSPYLSASIDGGTITYTVNNATEVYLKRKNGDVEEEIRDGLSSEDGEHTYTLKQGGNYVLRASNPSNEVAEFNVGTTYKVNVAVRKGGGGSVRADEYVAEGQSVTVTAVSVDNYTFDKWYTDAVGTTELAATATMTIDSNSNSGNVQTLVLNNIRQDINLYAGFKQNVREGLTAGKVYVYYTDDTEGAQSVEKASLMEAYEYISGLELSQAEKTSVQYVITGDQTLSGASDNRVVFNLDDGQILSGALGDYKITVGEFATLNIGNETVSNRCNSRTGTWHTGEGEINSNVSPAVKARGANIASKASIVVNGGQVNLDGQRSAVQNAISLYPDNKVNLVSDLNTGNYLSITLLGSDGAVLDSEAATGWTKDVLISADATDGDASSTDGEDNQDYNNMAGRVKLTNDGIIELKPVHDADADGNDELRFTFKQANEIAAMTIPYYDHSTDFYDSRAVKQYSSLNDALDEVKNSNVGISLAAADNIVYLVNDVTGDVDICGDDPTNTRANSNFINYGTDSYNKNVSVVSAVRDTAEKVSMAEATEAGARTINGNVNIKSITGTVKENLYNAGKGYKVGTNWLLGNIKVTGNINIDTNSSLIITADKKWGTDEVMTLVPATPYAQGTVLASYETGATKNLANFKLPESLTNEGYVLGLRYNDIVLAKKTAALSRFRLTGQTNQAINSQTMTLALFGGTSYKAITAGTPVTSWFTNLPAGLSATVAETVSDGATELAITFSGTPTAGSTARLNVSIPGDNNSSGGVLTDEIYNANYNIVLAVYTIAFNGNGGEGVMDSFTVNDGEDYVIPQCMFAQPIEDCRFIGWAIDSNSDDVVQPAASESDKTTPHASVTYYAKWESTQDATPPALGNITKGSVSLTVNDAKADQDYRIKVKSTGEIKYDWAKPTGTSVQFNSLSALTEYTIETRIAATENINASTHIAQSDVTTLPHAEYPDFGISYQYERLTGLVVGQRYAITVSGNTMDYTAVQGDDGEDGIISINDAWFGKSVSLVRYGDGSSTGESEACTKTLAGRPAPPSQITGITKTNNTITFPVSDIDCVKYKVTDIRNEVLSNYGDADFTGNNESFVVRGLSEATIYKIVTQIKATGREPASYETETVVRTMVKHPIPAGEINYVAETIGNLAFNSLYTISYVDGSTFTNDIKSDSSGCIRLLEAHFGKTISVVRKGDVNYISSDAQSIDVTDRRDAPAQVEQANVTRDIYSLKVTNPVGTQQYALASSDGSIVKPWATPSETDITNEYIEYTGLTKGTAYQVLTRYPAVPETVPAKSASKFAATQVSTYDKEDTPNPVIDYYNEQITGLAANTSDLLDVKINDVSVDAEDIVAVPGTTGTIKIQEGWFGKTLKIMKKTADSTVSKDSEYSPAIELGFRPDAPGMILDTEITNGSTTLAVVANPLYEYSVYEVTADDIEALRGWFTPVNGVVTFTPVVANKAYNITTRVKATDTRPCSLNAPGKSVTTLGPEETPEGEVNYYDEMITGLVGGANYVIDSVECTADDEGKVLIEDAEHNYSWFGKTVNIIRKGDNVLTGDSEPQSLTINPRPATPARVSSNSLIKGTEYIYIYAPKDTQGYNLIKEDNSYVYPTWITPRVGDTILKFEGLTSGTTYKVVTMVNATDDHAKSYVSAGTTIKTAGTIDPPQGSPDYVNEKITGLNQGEKYIIDCTLEGGSTISDEFIADANGKIDMDSRWFGRDVVIVKEATDADKELFESESDYSEPQTLTIAERLEKPAAISADAVKKYYLYNAGGDGTSFSSQLAQNASVRIYFTLNNLPSNQEYRILDKDGNEIDGMSQWVTPTDGSDPTVSFNGLTAGTEYQIVTRSKATEDHPLSLPSDPVTVRAKSAEATPQISVDYQTGNLEGFVLHGNYILYNLTKRQPNSLYFEWGTQSEIPREYYGDTLRIFKFGDYFVSASDHDSWKGTTGDSIAIDINLGSIPEDFGANCVYTNGVDYLDLAISTDSLRYAPEDYEYCLTTTSGEIISNWIQSDAGNHVRFDNNVILASYLTAHPGYSLSGEYGVKCRIVATDSHTRSNIEGDDGFVEYEWVCDTAHDNSHTYTTLIREATPTATVDYSKERIINLPEFRNADYTDEDHRVPEVYEINGQIVSFSYQDEYPYKPYIDIPEEWYGSTISIVKKGKLDGSTLDSIEQYVPIEQRPATPTKVELGALSCDTSSITVNVTEPSQEYQLQYATGAIARDWVSPVNGKVVFNGLFENREYKVITRIKTMSIIPASQPSDASDSITTKYHEVTPQGAIDYRNQKLTGLVADADYLVNDVERHATDGELTMTESWFGSTISVVKKGNGTTSVNSLAQAIDVLPRQTPPMPVDPLDVKIGATSITIDPAEESQEYNLKLGEGSLLYDTWVRETAGKVVFSGLNQGTTYHIVTRRRATDILPESLPADPTGITTLIAESQPEGSISYSYERIENLERNKSFTIDTVPSTEGSSVTCTSDSNGYLQIEEAWFGKTLSIISNARDASYYESIPQTLDIPARPAAPDKIALANIAKGAGIVDGIGEDTRSFTVNGLDPDVDQLRLCKVVDNEEIEVTEGWINATSPYTFNDTEYMEEGATYKLYRRERATVTEFSSASTKATSVTTFITRGQPNATIDYVNEEITGLDENGYYLIMDDEYQADADGKINMKPEWFSNAPADGVVLDIIREGDGVKYVNSVKRNITVVARAIAPADVSEADLTPGSMTIDVNHVVAAQEYAVYNTVDDTIIGEWIAPEDGQTTIVFNGLTKATTYKIKTRFKATADAPSSQISGGREINTMRAEVTPNGRVDYATEKITGLVANKAYTVNGSAFRADADGNIQIKDEEDETWFGDTVIVVKKGNGTTTGDSESQSIDIAARPVIQNEDAEDILNNDTINVDYIIVPAPGSDTLTITIKPANELYEYRILDANGAPLVNEASEVIEAYDWTAPSEVPEGSDEYEASFTGLAAGTAYKIGARIKAITIQDHEAFCSEEITIATEATPAGVTDYHTEKITGLVAGVYTVICVGVTPEETDFDVDSDGTIDIEGSWFGKTIKVVKKGIVPTSVDSVPQSITLAARQDTPNPGNIITGVTTDKTTIKIDPADSDYKYKLTYPNGDIVEDWTDPEEVPGSDPERNQVIFDGLTPGETYYVVIKRESTDELPESLPSHKVITTRTSEGTPAAVVNYMTSKLIGLVAEASYTINGDSRTANEDGHIVIRNPQDESWYDSDITIIKKGSDDRNTVDSDAQTLHVNKRPDTPGNPDATAVTVDTKVITITPAASENEYKLTDVNGTEVRPWTSPFNDKVVFTELEPGTEYVIVIRKKATDTTPESDENNNTHRTTLTAEATPRAEADYATEMLTGLIADNYYIINNGATAYQADTDGNIAIAGSWFGTTIQIVKKSTGADKANSEAQELPITARPEQPTQIATDDIKRGTVTIKINPAVATQEYMLKDSSGNTIVDWTDPTHETTPDDHYEVTFSELTENVIYKVVTRVKAVTDTEPKTPKSSETDGIAVKTLITETTPNGVINYQEEKINGLVAGAEYIINDGVRTLVFTADSLGNIPVDNNWFAQRTIRLIKKGITGISVNSAIQLLPINPRPAIPTEPDMEADPAPITSDVTTITIDPANPNYLYQLTLKSNNTVIKPWVSPVDRKVIFTGLESDVEYVVTIKVKSIGDRPESKPTDGIDITTKTAEDQPAATVNYAAKKLENLIGTEKYLIDGTEYTAADGKIDILEAWYGTTLHIIKKGNGTTTVNSTAQSLAVAERPTTPAEVPTANIQPGTVTIIINPAVSTYEYMLKKADGTEAKPWTSPDETPKVVFEGLTEGTIYKVVARVKQTDDAPESIITEGTPVITKSTEGTPNAAADYVAEKLTDLVPGASYTINDAPITADATGETDIAEGWFGHDVVIIKKGIGTTTVDSEPQTLGIRARGVTPSEPAADAIEITTTTITIDPADAACEYKLNNALGNEVKPWTSPTDGKVIFSGLNRGQAYSIVIRRKANDEASPKTAQSEEIVINNKLMREDTPNAAVDYSDEKLTGLVANANYTINGTAITADESGNTTIMETWFGSNASIIRKGNGITTIDSIAQSLAIAGRPTAPGGEGTPDIGVITAETTTITIDPADDAYEYKLNNAAGTQVKPWTSPTDDKVIFSELPTGVAYNVVIRVKAVTEGPNEAPKSIIITVPKLLKEATPTGTVDYINNKLTGFVASAAYTVNGNAMTADAAGKFDIAASWLGTGVSVVKNGVAGISTDSDAQTITLLAKEDAPEELAPEEDEITYTTTTITINPADADSKYMLTDEDGAEVKPWTAPTNGKVIFTDLNPGETYNIVVKKNPTADKPETRETNPTPVTILFKEATPNGAVDYLNNKITGLEASKAYSISGTAVESDASGMIAIRDTWIGNSVAIIRKGTPGTSIDSDAQTLAINAKPDAPTDLKPEDDDITYTTTTITIDPADADSKYKLTDAAGEVVRDWAVPTDGKVIFTDLEQGKPYRVVVKKNPTDTTPESKETDPKIVTTLVTETTPNAAVDYVDEKLTGLVPAASYTISCGNDDVSVRADIEGEVVIDESWFGEDIAIIKKGNGTTTVDSAAQTLSIADRAQTPGTEAITAIEEVIITDTTSITINPADDAYEYKLNNAAGTEVKPWTSPDEEDKVVFDNLPTGVAYNVVVRIKAVAEEPAAPKSEEVTLPDPTLLKEEAPEGRPDYENNKIKDLEPSEEYIIKVDGEDDIVIPAGPDGKLDIIEEWFGKDVEIIKKGDPDITDDSTPQVIVINAKPDAPSDEIPEDTEITIETTTITIYPAADDCKYKLTDADGEEVKPWTAPTDRRVIFTGLDEGETYNIVVKKNPDTTESTFESEETAPKPVVTKAKEATPAAVADYEAEKLTGLTEDADYTINGTPVTADADGKITINDSWFGDTILIIRKGNGDTTVNSEAQSLVITAREAQPAPLPVSDIRHDTDKITIDPADDTKEYRLKDSTGAEVKPWTSPDEEHKVVFDGLDEGTTYIVVIRIKGTDETPASPESDSQPVITKTKEDTPVVVVDYDEEKIKNLTPEDEYLINEVIRTADADGNIVIEEEWFGDELEIIKKGKDNSVDSEPLTIIINDRPDAPEDKIPADDVIIIGTTTITINPAADDCKYMLTDSEGGVVKDWTAPTLVTGSDDTYQVVFDGLSDGVIYKIVVKENPTDSTFESEETTPKQVVTIAKEITPDADVDYVNEMLTGFDADTNYIINGTPVTADSDGNITINDSWFGNTVLIIRKGNGDTTADSDAQSLVIAARETKPSPVPASNIKYDTDEIIIENADDNKEYRLKDQQTGEEVKPWTSPDGEHKVVFDELDEGNIYIVVIRIKATDEKPASPETDNTPIITKVKETAPTVVVDYENEKLTGFTPGNAYTINDTDVTADATGKLTIREEWFGEDLIIIKKGNGTTTVDSAPQTIEVAARPEAPEAPGDESIKIGNDNITIETDDNNVVYKLTDKDGEEVKPWTAPTGNKVIFTDLVEDTEYIIVIKKLQDDNNPGSEEVEKSVTTIIRETAPAPVVDYQNEKIKDLEPGAKYLIDNKEYIADEDGEITIIDRWFGTEIEVIKKGDTVNTDNSTPIVINVADKPEKPSIDVTVIKRGTDNIVIENADENLEYKLTDSTGGVVKEWTSPDDENKVVFDELAEGGVYRVVTRVKPTDDTPKSPESDGAVIITKTYETQPSADADYQNKKLTGLLPGSKYIINDIEYTADKTGKLDIVSDWFGKTVDIIKKGNGVTTDNSNKQSLTIAAVPAAPEAAVDYQNEQIKNLVPEAEYIINRESVTADDKGIIDIAEGWFGKDIQIIKKGDEDTADSDAQTIKLNSRPAKPVNVTAADIKKDTTVITVNSANDALEYKLTDAEGKEVKPWTSPADGKVEFKDLTEGTIYKIVTRVKTTDTAPISPESDGTIVMSLTTEAAPEAAADYQTEMLTGLIAKAVYIVNGTEYTADATGRIAIDSSWYGKKITVVKKGTANVTADSKEQSIILTYKPAVPEKVSSNDTKPGTTVITIKPAVDGQVYQLYGPTGNVVIPWTAPVNNEVVFTGLEEGQTYKVVTKKQATENAPESLHSSAFTVTTLVTPAAPEASVDENTTVIKGLEAGQKYKITVDGTDTIVTASENGEIPVTAYYNKTISIAKTGDDVTTADSTPQVITVGDKPQGDVENDKYIVTGVIKDDTGKIVTEASIDLIKGTDIIDTTDSAEDGSFIFNDVPSGIYSVVITYADQVTTRAIEVGKDSKNTFNFDIPAGLMSSIVDIEDPTVVGVEGLPAVFEEKVEDSTKGITEEEKANVENGGNIEIKLQVKASTDAEKETERQQIVTIADTLGASIAAVLDFTLLKTITTVEGAKSEVVMNELPQLITVYADIPVQNQGKSNYRVFRYHETSVDIISPTPNADGEYMELSKDGKQVIIHVRKFSTYAIGFDNTKSTPAPATPAPATQAPATQAPSIATPAPATKAPVATATPKPSNDDNNGTAAVNRVEMNIPTITMVKQMGFKSKFKILLTNTSGADITYASSDMSIATVDKKGIISTKSKEGTVTIVLNMVKDNVASQFVVKVKVKKGIAKSYSLKRFSTSYKGMSAVLYKALTKGKTYKIGLSHLKASSKTTYKSSNKKIATVDKKGNIKGLKAGRTNITITTKQDGVTYKYFIVLRVIEKGVKTNMSYLKIIK